jgi:hypothetical protein
MIVPSAPHVLAPTLADFGVGPSAAQGFESVLSHFFGMLRVLVHVLAFSFLTQRARAALRALSMRSGGSISGWFPRRHCDRFLRLLGSFLATFTIYAQLRGARNAPRCRTWFKNDD